MGGVAQPIGEFIVGLPFEPIVYVTPEAWAESFGKGEWDLAIGPRAVAPEGKADVISDLWLVDLIYLASPGHEFAVTTQIDRPGVKIGAIKGSPSDKYLTRTLKSAQLIRIALNCVGFGRDAPHGQS